MLWVHESKDVFSQLFLLRWLEIVSSTYILMGRYNHSLSLDATIKVSKNYPTIGERCYYFRDTIGYHSNSITC